MLENTIDILLAREQTGLLLAGFALILLGGAMLADYLLTLKNRMKIKGKIIGLREKSGKGNRENSVFFPVIEYISTAGKKIQAETDSGSSTLTNKIPGTEVYILVNPEEPCEVRLTGLTRPVLTSIFLIAGFLLIFLAASQYDFTFWTLLIVAIAVSVLVPRLFRQLTAKESKHALSEKSYKERVLEKRQLNEVDKTDLIGKIRKQKRQANIMNPVMILISIMLALGGVYMANNVESLKESGVFAEGTVVEYEREFIAGENRTSYYPVVEFLLPDGKTIRFRDSSGSSQPVLKSGEKVAVIYDPAQPGQAMIDRGAWNLLPAAGLVCTGFLLFVLGIKSIITYAGVENRLRNLVAPI
jgi:hypothetical protein